MGLLLGSYLHTSAGNILGWVAIEDMLLVDGDPLKDIAVAVNPDNFLVIMKDGAVYKDTMD